jgi:hypothetical protein
MLIPLALYPLAPDEPVAVGDRVLADGKQTVALADPARYHAFGYKTTCVLEPHDRLIVQEDRPSLPFCPPKAEVLLLPHQIVKKERLSVLIRETVRKLIGA